MLTVTQAWPEVVVRRSKRSFAVAGLAALIVASVWLVAPGAPAGAAPPPIAGATRRVTHSTTGAPLSTGTDSRSDVSADGRFVAFNSVASNVVSGDTNGNSDVFVADRLTGTIERVSVTSDEAQANNDSSDASISDDGRYVSFLSRATNLVPSGTTYGPWRNGYVRDRLLGTTTVVTFKDTTETFLDASFLALSGDGKRVSFASAVPFVAADVNGQKDVYVRTVSNGVIQQASVTDAEAQTLGAEGDSALDYDGSVVAFSSSASMGFPTVSGATNLYARDLTAGTTQLLSQSTDSVTFAGSATNPSLSADGRYVAFDSSMANLAPGGVGGVFVRDRTGHTTERVSIRPDGTPGGGGIPSISADGSRIAFETGGDFIPGATCSSYPALRDRVADVTLSLFNPTSTECGGDYPSISANGRHVTATSVQALVSGDPGDTDAQSDVYVYPLTDALFADVAAVHPFFEEISWMIDKNVSTGYGDGFHPADAVSRQAVAAFMYRMAGQPAFVPVPGAPHFADVPAGHPFYDAIEWAYKQGIITGYPDGGFHPTRPVTRQAMASFLYKLADSPPVFLLFPSFSDVPLGHTYYMPIGWMAVSGLGKGFPNGSFHPTDPVTRQSAAAFLFRYRWAYPSPF